MAAGLEMSDLPTYPGYLSPLKGLNLLSWPPGLDFTPLKLLKTAKTLQDKLKSSILPNMTPSS